MLINQIFYLYEKPLKRSFGRDKCNNKLNFEYRLQSILDNVKSSIYYYMGFKPFEIHKPRIFGCNIDVDLLPMHWTLVIIV